ncbi:hypothetical protein IC582_025748 [Cucumis melo]
MLLKLLTILIDFCSSRFLGRLTRVYYTLLYLPDSLMQFFEHFMIFVSPTY